MRVLLYGRSLGVAVVVTFAAYLSIFGALTTYLDAGQLVVLSLAIPLAVPTLAASVQALG